MRRKTRKDKGRKRKRRVRIGLLGYKRNKPSIEGALRATGIVRDGGIGIRSRRRA